MRLKLMRQAGSDMRTLIIDDSRLDRQLIRKLLKTSDIEVDIEEAEDASSALDTLADNAFDCLVVDQRMPGIVGTEFIRTFRDREEGARTPILVLSGDHATKLTIEEALGAGGDFFMAKKDLTAKRLKAALSCLGQAR